MAMVALIVVRGAAMVATMENCCDGGDDGGDDGDGGGD
jgi:hypothetical protein